jgi:polyisoprenoid-binding protein YceI
MKRHIAMFPLLAGALVATPPAASAEIINFKLLPNPSRVTWRTDAPLETVIGNASGAGLSGELRGDPGNPLGAAGSVKIDLTAVKTGIDRRDADMRGKPYLDTDTEANRYATFELKGVEMASPLVPGKEAPAKVRGILTIKQRPTEILADASIWYIKLTPDQVEQQKRFGFTGDNIRIKAKFGTKFTNHDMQVPQLLFLKLSNDIQLEADLTFVRQ